MYFLKQCENNDHEVLIKEREAKRHVTRSSRMNNRPRSDGAAPAWNGMTLTSASSVRPSVSFWAFGPLGRPGWMEKKIGWPLLLPLFPASRGDACGLGALERIVSAPGCFLVARGPVPSARAVPRRPERTAPPVALFTSFRFGSRLPSPPPRILASSASISVIRHDSRTRGSGDACHRLTFFPRTTCSGGTTDATVMPVNRTPQACVTWPKRCAPRTEPHLCQKRNVLTSQEDT